MTALERMAAMRGSVLIDGEVTQVSYHSLMVNADCTITVIKTTTPGKVEVDQLTAMNLSGKTIKAGGLLTAPEGSVFTSITVTSGQLIGY